MGGFVFPHGWLVPQGYDLKALKPIGHLLAVDPHLSILVSLDCLKCGSYCQLYAG
ncbi:hypothetical protein [uncultured Virgibacillus sp.]|uniref:hypothetical protein n=1 Tax=uncultured Virgibacillus sp. TaxID=417355 RepID=UPI002602BCB2|nr:hypothetical protein [uncultured Virgibacillus sp.]